MRLVRAALDAPYTVIVVVLAVVVLGITTLGRMPVDILPQFQTPAVQIVTFYPGMPAEVMEKDISSRLQRWTGQSVGIARQEARNLVGVSIVKNFFHENVNPADAIAQVTSYAMSDLFYLFDPYFSLDSPSTVMTRETELRRTRSFVLLLSSTLIVMSSDPC